MVNTHRFAVIYLMEIQMPDMDGIQATRYITEHGHGKVLILTTSDEDDLVKYALQNGAHAGASEADDPFCALAVYYLTGISHKLHTRHHTNI